MDHKRKRLEERMAAIVQQERELDERSERVSSVDEAFAILRDGNDLMGKVINLACEHMTPEERAAQDRYNLAVTKPTADVFGAELRAILDEHGPKAMRTAALAIFRDLATQIDEIDRRNRGESN